MLLTDPKKVFVGSIIDSHTQGGLAMRRCLLLSFALVFVFMASCHDEQNPDLVQLRRKISTSKRELARVDRELAKAKAALKAAKGAEAGVEKPKTEEGKKKSSPKCTLDEAVKRHKFEAEKRGQWNKESAQRFDERVNVVEVARKKFPAPEQGLPSLPADTLAVRKDVYTPELDAEEECRVNWKLDEEKKEFVFENQDWPFMASLINIDFKEADMKEEEEYTLEVDLISGVYLIPSWLGKRELNIELFERLKRVAENEDELKAAAENLLPMARTIFGRFALGKFRTWLPDFFKASYVDMAVLEDAVKAADESQNGYSHYLTENNKKLEGWFMRRWRNLGRGQTGDDTIVIYRFWMVKLAKVLEMPEADEWAKKVSEELASTKTLRHKEWYLAQLVEQE